MWDVGDLLELERALHLTGRALRDHGLRAEHLAALAVGMDRSLSGLTCPSLHFVAQARRHEPGEGTDVAF